MAEVPLARLWHVPDGPTCLLLKDPQVENWEVRVIRNGVAVRSERFASAIVAMEVAKKWRADYEPQGEPAG